MGLPAQNRFNVDLVVNASRHQTEAVLFHRFWRLFWSTSSRPFVDAASESTVLFLGGVKEAKRLSGIAPSQDYYVLP
jgi:hypothetical protein